MYEENHMPEAADDFGTWRTAADGTAHYLLAGKCLCGAKVKANAPEPVRSEKSLALLTPLCVECLDLNISRWRGAHGDQSDAPLRPQKTFWWREVNRRKIPPTPRRKLTKPE
jgi:hypothetical protein